LSADSLLPILIAMELLLIRHALPIRRVLLEGAADPELSEAGHAQAQHLAQYLSSEHLDAIYSSPMRRAMETGAPTAQARHMTMTIIDDVAEHDRNSSEYVPVEELKATNDPRWLEMVNNEWSSPDETQAEFGERVRNSIEAVISRHEGQRVAIVCHGGVINSYLAGVLGLGDVRGFFYPNYTSINRVLASRNGDRQVLTVNETSHLRGTGLPIGLHTKS
jgi:2,3-bisphosphoglycerate-dependent phosphoglycerate mutase